ncbi:cytochrome c oxidase subunit 6b-1-like [Rhododendron vialii]|uniref:cytochrome c oxidase subunit 6b-1-like n=1 Tax=Rhododendron vialii TaxID=182163 RepID=UPI00265D7548|nr:cytochrome c oxidase subunit 6b-1-like [Rhododendron vialii]
MAEADSAKTLTLSEEYMLKEKEEKLDMVTKPAEESEMKNTDSAAAEEVSSSITDETPVVGSSNDVDSAAADESSAESSAAAEESNETTPSAGEGDSEATEAAADNSSGNAEQEDSRDQEGEETPEIKLETAPADFRFPTTNQSRHCFTRYIEYHRCVAAKGEGAPECDKFAKYYRSLCPGEWVDRWNEQRENGTFPGPL